MTRTVAPADVSPHTPSPQSPAARAGAMALVATTIFVLHHVGRGDLAAPPLESLEGLRAWAADRDPITIGFIAVRLIALAVSYHLVATTLLMVLGKAFGRPILVRLADSATLPPLRGTVRRLVGLGLSTGLALGQPLPTAQAHPQVSVSLVTSGVPGDPAGLVVVERISSVSPGRAVLRVESPGTHTQQHGDRATLERIDAATEGDEPAVLERIDSSALPGGRATLQRIDEGPAPADQVSSAPAVEARPPAEEGSESQVEVDVGGTHHVVEPGDHLWSIAADRLAREIGRSPTDAEISPYWESLVAANPQLVDPDLLFPGDEIQVPPAPVPGST